MEHYFYIIFSKSKNLYYYGETSDLYSRLVKHNDHTYVGSFTRIAKDWDYVVTHKCDSKAAALYLESFVKKMRNRNFTKKIIENPEILDDILSNR